MPLLHRAAWVLPIVRPPIRDGWVLVDRGQIIAVGGTDESVPVQPGIEDGHALASSAILPGLVNAHTHLELSWMRNQIAPSPSMPAWVERLLALRGAASAPSVEAIVDAVEEMRATGTTLVGDVGNTLASYEPLAGSELSAMLFREVIGFNPVDPRGLVSDAYTELAGLTPLAWIRSAVVPHAPYSVSEALFREIAAAAGDKPISVHLGESAEELEFLRSGTGPWQRLLQRVGVWSSNARIAECAPVEFLDRVGLLHSRLLAVHCVQLEDAELARLAAAGATVVTCPRSNRWTGAGAPPVDRFYGSGVRVAIGTDSLASVEDLNLFGEIAAVRKLAPRVPASRILRSATLDGAAALGFGSELGSLEPGKRAELIAVRVPDAVNDVNVEEYLVSGGVSPSDIRWVGAY